MDRLTEKKADGTYKIKSDKDLCNFGKIINVLGGLEDIFENENKLVLMKNIEHDIINLILRATDIARKEKIYKIVISNEQDEVKERFIEKTYKEMELAYCKPIDFKCGDYTGYIIMGDSTIKDFEIVVYGYYSICLTWHNVRYYIQQLIEQSRYVYINN